MNASDHPLVRVVVLNFDGGQMTLDCLDSLLASEWPQDRLEIVLVDNGSLDYVAHRVTRDYSTVQLLEPLANLGFAGGCNLGISQPGDHQYVALVNNDATVAPDWLQPLVQTASAAPDIGAACAKMLFADRYLDVRLSVKADSSCRRDRGEPGVQVTAVRIDGVRKDEVLAFDELFFETPPSGLDADEEIVHSSRLGGAMRVVADPARPLPRKVAVRLVAPREREVTITTEADQRELAIGPTPVWVEVSLGDEPFDVINNVGSNLYANGFGGDRGFLQRDCGQYEQQAEVFAWCGGAVLLRREYLDAIGLFDERLFLYYEDTDLSWRGRLQGWRYVYEPRSLVRHRHAASSGVGSPLFRFHTERNRLLVLAKNAPARLALRAFLGEVRRCARAQVSGYVLRPLRLQLPERVVSGHRRRVLASYLRLLPAMLRDRCNAHPTINRTDVMRWEISK